MSAESIRARQIRDVANISPLGDLLRQIGLRAGFIVNNKFTSGSPFDKNILATEKKINALERQLGRKVTVFPPLSPPRTKVVLSSSRGIDTTSGGELITTSPDIEERVIDRVADRLEQENKVKRGTLPASEISRIIEVGSGGGEQLSTS